MGVKSVKLIYFFKILLFYSGAWSIQSNCIVMMTKEGSIKIVNFMTPGAGVLVLGRGHISHIMKCIISLKTSFLLPGIDQKTKYLVMMTKEGSTYIVNFMTPGAGVLALGRGHISHIMKMHYFFKNLLLYSLA